MSFCLDFRASAFFFVHLVLGLFLFGLDGLQHLPGLLGRNLSFPGLLTLSGLIVLILLILILVLVLILILVLFVVLASALLILVL